MCVCVCVQMVDEEGEEGGMFRRLRQKSPSRPDLFASNSKFFITLSGIAATAQLHLFTEAVAMNRSKSILSLSLSLSLSLREEHKPYSAGSVSLLQESGHHHITDPGSASPDHAAQQDDPFPDQSPGLGPVPPGLGVGSAKSAIIDSVFSLSLSLSLFFSAG